MINSMTNGSGRLLDGNAKNCVAGKIFNVVTDEKSVHMRFYVGCATCEVELFFIIMCDPRV